MSALGGETVFAALVPAGSRPRPTRVNVNGSVDEHYRYTMPRLLAAVPSARAKTMSRTLLLNIEDVSHSLRRPPDYLTHFVGAALSVRAEFSASKPPGENCYVGGTPDAATLSELVRAFIQTWVLCARCGDPGTRLDVRQKKGGRGVVKLRCGACGHSEEARDPGGKFLRHVLAHPPAPPREHSALHGTLRRAELTVKREKRRQKKKCKKGAARASEKKLIAGQASKEEGKDAPPPARWEDDMPAPEAEEAAAGVRTQEEVPADARGRSERAEDRPVETPEGRPEPEQEDEEQEDEEQVDEEQEDEEQEDEEQEDEEQEDEEQEHEEQEHEDEEEVLRAPICCVLGHVDAGKTSLLDQIRRTDVQRAEAGGITQQLGCSFFPIADVKARTATMAGAARHPHHIPGLLILDTPGHEMFHGMRERGSGLCDIAILVVDITKGLEAQTLGSMRLLRSRGTPFIVALNKVDRCFGWESLPNLPFRRTLRQQEQHVQAEFQERLRATQLALSENGLNSALYWQNPCVREYISIVPLSAQTGEGVPDLLLLLVQLAQSNALRKRVRYRAEVEASVLEVTVEPGLGTSIDVVLTGGTLCEGDTIVLGGLHGAITTRVRALLTPHPMAELRARGRYQRHASLRAAQGAKVVAHELEHAVAGSMFVVCREGDDLGALRRQVDAQVQRQLEAMVGAMCTQPQGIHVQASTMGSLQALLVCLREAGTPVASVALGPVRKRDVVKAATMLSAGEGEGAEGFASILAFDVRVDAEVRQLAQQEGVGLYESDVMYSLQAQFAARRAALRAARKRAAAAVAVFPCCLTVLECFHRCGPVIMGVEVKDGTLHVGTPLAVPAKGRLALGHVASIQADGNDVQHAHRGARVAIRVAAQEPRQSSLTVGR